MTSNTGGPPAGVKGAENAESVRAFFAEWLAWKVERRDGYALQMVGENAHLHAQPRSRRARLTTPVVAACCSRLTSAAGEWITGRGALLRMAALLGFGVLLAGCSKPGTTGTAGVSGTTGTAASTNVAAATKPAAKADGSNDERYPLTGQVLRIEADRKVLVVRHDEIKGYMPAMTMKFVVAPADLAAAKVGQRIRAELVPGKPNDDFRLEKIWPDDKVGADTVAASALQLRQETHTRGKNAYREIGETVPDFALYDQAGGVVQSARFRGKQIMLNFIFTRCPDAKMCPASTAKMMAAQKMARDAGVPNVEFVSITLDPAYDTPAVLQDYAKVRGIDTKNFSFLTGPENAIRDLLTQFGVIAQFQGDILQHTLTTLLIDANGKIAHRADGSGWEPDDFVAKMKR